MATIPSMDGCHAAPRSNWCAPLVSTRLGRSLFPKVNVAAATSISHGSRRRKLESEVRTKSCAPSSPPATLVSPRITSHCRDVLMSPRYANVLEIDAGHSASVDVALATTGDTPATMSAGKVRNDPPPATAFSPPPMAAAKNNRMITARIVQSMCAEKRRSHPAVDDPSRDRTGARSGRDDRRPGVAVRRHHPYDPPRPAGARGGGISHLRRSIARRWKNALGAQRTGVQGSEHRFDAV